ETLTHAWTNLLESTRTVQLRHRRADRHEQTHANNNDEKPDVGSHGDSGQCACAHIDGHYGIHETDRHLRQLRRQKRSTAREYRDHFIANLHRGFSVKTNSLTGRPSMRCSWMIRSMTSGVTE